jgi:hypothetical protein
MSGQYGYRDSNNRIGINIGVNQFSLNTNNFQLNQLSGMDFDKGKFLR